MSRYSCAACGLAAIVTDEAVVVGCSCGAAVVADMSVTLEGRGGVRS